MTRNFKAIFILLAIFTTSIAFAQTPVKQDLAGIATLNFPAEPTEGSLPNGAGKFLKTEQPTANYIAIIVHIDTAQIPVKNKADIDLLYSGVVDGAADSTQDRKLIYTKQITIDKYRAVEFKYVDASKSKKFTVYQRIIYLDQTLFMYNYSVYNDTTPGNDAERERFFNSFTVTKTTARQL